MHSEHHGDELRVIIAHLRPHWPASVWVVIDSHMGDHEYGTAITLVNAEAQEHGYWGARKAIEDLALRMDEHI